MDNIILTLDQHEIDPVADTGDRDSYYVRHAARAVLLDTQGRCALLHSKRDGYYKLPGGGVDDGENVSDALARELLEEVGAVADITAELGMVVEWRDFVKMKQYSYAHTAVAIGELSGPQYTQKELDAGFEVVWADNVTQAMQMVWATENHEELGIRFMTWRDAEILRHALS
jgi:8-oxo-dGTP pyrophosphatase MutT (NUDIX family)